MVSPRIRVPDRAELSLTNSTGVSATQEEEPKAEEPAAPIVIEPRLAALEAENAKLRNDLRSIQTGNLKQGQRDAKIDSILERLDRNERKSDALYRALAAGETAIAALPEEMGKIDTEARTQTTEQDFTRRATLLRSQLDEAVMIDGKPFLDVRTAPELADVRNAWDEGLGRKDLVDLAGVVAQAALATVQAYTKRPQVVEEPKKPAVETPKPRADLSAGRPAAGIAAYGSLDALRAAFIEDKIPKDEYQRVARERFNAFV